MKYVASWLVPLILASCAEGTLKEPYNSIPKAVRDWTAEEEDKFYDRQTLYNYIDGGAELYLTYDFQEAFIRRFMKAGETDLEIVLDVYNMGTSQEAFGIFSCEREDEGIGVGQDSEYGGGLLRFWKDRYFVSMVALGEEENAKPAMIELAQAVADAIPSTGSRPTLVSMLPRDGLVEREIRFFHTMQCLNNHFFLASEDILELGKGTDCVFARYGRQEETGYLLVVKYASEPAAKSAFESFLDAYMPEAIESGFAQLENRRWTLARNANHFSMVVLDAPARDWAEQLLSEVRLEEE